MKFVQGFNLFPKLQEAEYDRSSCGGALFLATLALTFILVAHEVLRSQPTVELYIAEQDFDHRIQVHLNISVHHIPCSALQLDLKDMTGLSLRDITHTLRKSPINNGLAQPVERTANLQFNDSCYGAQLYENQRCLTCQDVMIAFQQRRWLLPNLATIKQCVPEGHSVLPFDDFQQQYYDLLNIQQEETLEGVKEQLKDIKVSDILKDENEEDEETQPLKGMMTDDQKQKFKEALMELSEITYNPMQWDEERLKQEKGTRVESLIGMLNISLDSIGNNLANQIRFADREKVISSKNLSFSEEVQLTEVYRHKCEHNLKLSLNLTAGESISFAEVEMEQGQCALPVFYQARNESENLIIAFRLAELRLEWVIGKNHTLLNSFMINIDKIMVFNKEYDYSYSPQGMLDKAYSQFRMNVYKPIIRTKPGRMLFTEQFSVEQTEEGQVFADQIQTIEEQLSQGCQLSGYFYLKRVPGAFSILGKRELLKYVKQEFNASHTIHELRFSEQGSRAELKSGESTNYYLKLVSTKSVDFWNEKRQYYQYTILQSPTVNKSNPTIQFNYEFDPISIKYEASRLGEYLVSIFAVIGGVFALSKYLSSLLCIWGR